VNANSAAGAAGAEVVEGESVVAVVEVAADGGAVMVEVDCNATAGTEGLPWAGSSS